MSAALSDWDARLSEHFRRLRTERDQFGPGHPVFALEHGLDVDRDVPELAAAVRGAVAGGRLPTERGLPFVVYAAEVGYRYQGDEYWPTFEAETPRWRQRGSAGRLYIRKRYESFAEKYGGAIPSGAWAAWFKNIAWPITHAVLPTDLQRHLARLLYDYRRALTTELLDDHDALGERLARRSLDTSARFRKFAENSQLLGLVAASLLLGDEEGSALLSSSTLHRIVVDLSHERQAGAWLRDAKKAAVRVRRRGLTSLTTSAGTPTLKASDEERHPRLELELSVRRGREGWCAYVALPSHESLAQRVPGVRREVEQVRYKVHGVDGTQPRGALMYRRGPVALTEWPKSFESVIEPEGASGSLLSLLVDTCRMSGGPWLFRLREPGLGFEVRTNSVRPGEEYVLLTHEKPAASDAISWDLIAMRTCGIVAFRLTIPETVDAKIISELQQLGVGVTSNLEVWPAGLVPVQWDGEGTATWLAGEDPIIGLHSSRSATACVISTELEIARLPWPPGSDLLFVQLSDLAAGNHHVDVALVEDGVERPIAEGQLQVRVLEPADSSASVGARQGLQVRSHPSRPTLEDVWTGEAAVAADGPHGEKVHFSVSLMTRGGRQTLARTTFSSALPVSETRWHELFRGARGSGDLVAVYDVSEEIVVRASSPILGATEIRAQRPFAPLRWCVGSDREGPFARLIDHMDSGDLKIEYYDVPHPGSAVAPAIDGDDKIRTGNGGLVVATASGLKASVVLPPHISGGLESLERLSVRPSLQTGSRSADSVKRMILLSHLWTRAAMPANVYAEQLQARVNDSIISRLGGMIGGDKWWEIELIVLDGRRPTDQRLIDAVGRFPADRQAAIALLAGSAEVGREQSARSRTFATVIGAHSRGRYEQLADPILRLASAPGSLSVDDPSVLTAIDEVLRLPVPYRLARLFVLAISVPHDGSAADASARNWTWD